MTTTSHAITNTLFELRAVLLTVETAKRVSAKVTIGELEASHRTSGHNFNRLRHAVSTAAWELDQKIKAKGAVILPEQQQVLDQLQQESWDAIEMLKKSGFEVLTVSL